MVMTQRFEAGSGSGSGTGGQNGPVVSEDRIKVILKEEVVAHFYE